MTIGEMISVLQAAKDGQTVQYRRINRSSTDVWLSVVFPIWDFDKYEYRVKPEPREFWIDPRTDIAWKERYHGHIHVREVL